MDLYRSGLGQRRGGAELAAEERVLDALEQAICARGGARLAGVVHHSDHGSQYLSMRYTDRLADGGIAPSVGSRGDAYDNALAESVIGLFKTEVIRRQGPWRSLEAVELATLTWVDWFNTERPHEYLDDLTPARAEELHYIHTSTPTLVG